MFDVLTVSQFAHKLGISQKTVYAAASDGRVNTVRLFGRIGIPKNELKRFKRRLNGSKTWVVRKTQNGKKK